MIDPGTATLIGTGLNIAGGLFSQSSARGAYQHRYQDTVKDMRKAGLNPALAYGQNPGAGAQTHDFGDEGSKAASAYQTASAARQARANAELTEAQTGLLKAQKDNLILRTGLENERIQSETHGLDQLAALRSFEKDLARETLPANLRLALARALREELGVPEARAYADFYRSSAGRSKPYLDLGSNTARGTASALASIAAMRSSNAFRKIAPFLRKVVLRR